MREAGFKLITFDVTNTLIRPNNFVEKYTSACSRHNLPVDSSKIRSSFSHQFNRYSELYPNYGLGSEFDCQQWWTGLVKDALKDSGAPDTKALDQVSDELYWTFQTKDGWIPEPESYNTLQSLKKSGIKIGVISNFDSRLESILKDLKFHEYFDFIVGSYEVGYMKPEKEIFDLALRKGNVKPGECVHVGDLMDCDYLGAKNAGIRGIWYNPAGQASEVEVNGEDEILSLSQLFDIVR